MEDLSFDELNARWKLLLAKLGEQFGEEPDLQAIIFLIGVQELGAGKRDFTKDQKMDLMHIATCKLLSRYGYYIYAGVDKDNWPQWTLVEKLPALNVFQQERLLKEAVISYFEDITYITE